MRVLIFHGRIDIFGGDPVVVGPVLHVIQEENECAVVGLVRCVVCVEAFARRQIRQSPVPGGRAESGEKRALRRATQGAEALAHGGFATDKDVIAVRRGGVEDGRVVPIRCQVQ
jgi:hypothetical protein